MSDYERIAQAISFINEHVKSQPTLNEIAAHLHMSQYHFQRLFGRWTGVTPKRYLQTLTVERAKKLLLESQSLLEISESLGLSSGSRLYDHFVTLEAVTPGEYRNGGVGLVIQWAVHDTPFGPAFIAATPKGICRFAFVDYSAIDQLKSELLRQWPQAEFRESKQEIRPLLENMFDAIEKPNGPLSLHVSGTNFQVSVWRALLDIPSGTVTSYKQVANRIGRPRAARAVGTAIGANPIALLIPCHRVIQQSGNLGGYHWGKTRMHAIHAWESARKESARKKD